MPIAIITATVSKYQNSQKKGLRVIVSKDMYRFGIDQNSNSYAAHQRQD